MRILHVIPSLGVGGTEKILLEICRGLDRSKFRHEVFALKGGGSTNDELRKSGVPVTQLRSPDRFIPGLLDFPRIFVSLRASIRMRRPDVVHTWLSRANVIGRLAARSAGVRGIVSSLRVMEVEKDYHLWAERSTHQFCSAVTVNSTALKDFAIEKIGIPAGKVKLIFNGVRPAADSISIGNISSQTPAVIGAMGRLHRQKGFDVLIRAIPQILEKFPAARFRIAGEGPERKNLEDLAKSLKVQSLEFAGLAPSGDFLKSLDVFVLPSRWEGMPNVVMEAMSLGLPVACSKVAGSEDLIGDGNDGLIFNPENPPACADAVLKLLGDLGLRQQCGAAARKKITEKFSMEEMLRQYEKLYESILL